MISAQNIVYYRDTLLNKVYRARLCHCILSPFPCPLICHGIRTAAVRGYSRSNPAKRIRRPGHCVPCLRQSQTSRRRFGNFRISENDFRYRNTVLPGACQSLSPGAAPKGRNRFFPICCSSRRRRYRLLFYSPPNPPAGSGTVPARTRLPGTFGDNTVPAHSNIIGGGPVLCRQRAFFDRFSNSGRDPPGLLFCGRRLYRSTRAFRQGISPRGPLPPNDIPVHF